jgi:hypothetical protein
MKDSGMGGKNRFNEAAREKLGQSDQDRQAHFAGRD